MPKEPGGGHDHGDNGAGSIPWQHGPGTVREKLIRPTTPADIMKLSLDKDYRAANYPAEYEDKTAAGKPYAPVAQVHPGQTTYDVLGCVAEVGASAEVLRRLYTSLAIGREVLFESAFQPAEWRVYFRSATTLQILQVSPGIALDIPYEWCQNNGANVKSDTLHIPGRTRYLAVRSPATNAATLEVTVVALAGFKGLIGGYEDRG